MCVCFPKQRVWLCVNAWAGPERTGQAAIWHHPICRFCLRSNLRSNPKSSMDKNKHPSSTVGHPSPLCVHVWLTHLQEFGHVEWSGSGQVPETIAPWMNVSVVNLDVFPLRKKEGVRGAPDFKITVAFLMGWGLTLRRSISLTLCLCGPHLFRIYLTGLPSIS